MAGASVELAFDSPAAEDRFVREYLADAWDRFEDGDYWTTGWFWAYGQFAAYDSGPDGGLVRLVFEGDPDGLVAAEADRWDGFEGLDSWHLRRYDEEGYDSLLEQQRDAKGEVGGEWEYRAKPLVSRFALAYRRAFDESLPPVGGEGSVGDGDGSGDDDGSSDGDGNPSEIGFWAVVHDLFVQCGYDWYDETAACRKMMANRLKSVAGYRGADAAREEYERLLAAWRAQGDELERWLDEHSTGNAAEP